MADRNQTALDARGKPFRPASILRATRSSGYGREYLLRNGDTVPFWRTFVALGLVFASLMWVIKAIGALTRASGVQDPFSLTAALQFLAHFVFFGGVMAGWASLYNWRTPTRAVDAMTAAGLCPCCAYSLEGVEPDPDGCTVCPECGSAWRLNA